MMIPWRGGTLKIIIDVLAFEKSKNIYISTTGGTIKAVIELLWVISARFFQKKQAYFGMPAFGGESELF